MFLHCCLLLALLPLHTLSQATTSFHCVGNCDHPLPRPSNISPGAALCGGHMYPGVTVDSDVDAYRYLVNRSLGGDFVVITADAEDTPCDLYNAFVYNLTQVLQPPNSVTTICFHNRSGAFLPRTATLLSSAAAVFFTGGDQSNYYNFFRDSPVATLLTQVPLVGGSSAGLAIQGKLLFDALHGGIDSEEALQYPTDSEVALANNLFTLRWMDGVLTDTHFFQR